MSKAWVVAPGAISTARSMPALGLLIPNASPQSTDWGAEPITGRGPLKR